VAEKLIAENRKARHEYQLLERYEAGLVLTGTEVKSLRAGGATLQRAYADVRDGEVWLVGAHIAEYGQGNLANHDPDRDRKLLLHRKEIASLSGRWNARSSRGAELRPFALKLLGGPWPAAPIGVGSPPEYLSTREGSFHAPFRVEHRRTCPRRRR